MSPSSPGMRLFKFLFIFISLDSIITLLQVIRINDPHTIQFIKYAIPIMWLNLLVLYTLIKLGGF